MKRPNKVALGLAMAFGSLGCGGGTVASKPPQQLSAPRAALPTAGWELVDLTWAFDQHTLYWPTSPTSFRLDSLAYGKTPGGWFYAANTLSTPEHGGTHMDAPIHFAEGKHTTEKVPLTRLVAPAVVIDMTMMSDIDEDALLTAGDVDAFEAKHGAIAAGTIVLVRTGWSSRWPDRKRYLGDDRPGNASDLHFPGIAESAAKLFVDRNVAAVGIDTASIDYGQSKNFITHQVLMKENIPAFENVAHLDRLPETGAVVVALPMKIAGGSGGPLRIIALLPPK